MTDKSRVAGDGEEVVALRGVATCLQEDNNRLLDVIQKLQTEKQHWKDDILQLTKEKSGLQRTIDKYKEEVKQFKPQIDKLRKENEDLKARLGEKDETHGKEKAKWKKSNEDLKKENERLQKMISQKSGELSATQKQLTDLRQRLTAMASERMQTANPALEDLSDPYRPTELATRWEQLFRSGEYWVVYEEIHARLKDDFGSTWMLYELCKMVHDSCAKAVGEIMEIELVAVKAWLEEPANHPNKMAFRRNIREEMRREMKKHTDAMPDALVRTLTFEERLALSKDLVETCLRHCEAKVEGTKPRIRQRLVQHLSKKGPPPSLLQSIFRRLEAEDQMRTIVSQKKYEKFVEQVFHLCYRMLTKEVPLAVRFDAGAGMTFDPSLYDNEQPEVQVDQSSTIELVLRPPLLRYQGGPVLVKGLAQVVPPKVQAATTAHPLQRQSGSRRPGTQGRGTGGSSVDGVSDEEDSSDRGRDDSDQVKPETTPDSPGQVASSPGGDKSKEGGDNNTDGDKSGERDDDKTDGDKSEERDDNNTDGDKLGEGGDNNTDGDKSEKGSDNKTDGDKSEERGDNKTDGDKLGEGGDNKTDGDKSEERGDNNTDGDQSEEGGDNKTGGDKSEEGGDNKTGGDKSKEGGDAKTADTDKA